NRRARRKSSRGISSAAAATVLAVPITHPLRIPDHLSVVGRNGQLTGQRVCRIGVANTPPGPFAVVSDEDHGGGRHGRGRLHECFDTAPRPRELLQMTSVGVVGGTVQAPLGALAPTPEPPHRVPPAGGVPLLDKRAGPYGDMTSALLRARAVCA